MNNRNITIKRYELTIKFMQRGQVVGRRTEFVNVFNRPFYPVSTNALSPRLVVVRGQAKRCASLIGQKWTHGANACKSEILLTGQVGIL